MDLKSEATKWNLEKKGGFYAIKSNQARFD